MLRFPTWTFVLSLVRRVGCSLVRSSALVLVHGALPGPALAVLVVRESADRAVRFEVPSPFPGPVALVGAICCSRMSAPCSTEAFRSRGRVRARPLFSARVALLMDWFQGTACLPLATRWRRPPTRRSGHRRWSIALSLALSPRGSACRVRGLSGRYAVRCSVVAALCFVFSLTLLQRPLPDPSVGSTVAFGASLQAFWSSVLALRALILRHAPCLSSPHVLGAIAVFWLSFFGPCDRPGPRVGRAAFRCLTRRSRVTLAGVGAASLGRRLSASFGRECGPVPHLSWCRCPATSVLLGTARLWSHSASRVPPLGAALPASRVFHSLVVEVARPSSSTTWWVRS